MTAIGATNGLTPYRAIIFQIVMADQTTTALHLSNQQVRGLAFIKAGLTVFFDALKHRCQISLNPAITN